MAIGYKISWPPMSAHFKSFHKHALDIIFFFGCYAVQAQSTIGVTGVKDTSFTTYSAYQNTKKTHPQLNIVRQVKTSSVKEKQSVPYCKTGKRVLVMDVFYPAFMLKQKWPAIMIIHGGGWRSGDKSQHHALAQSLAALGYVCFIPEYRLSTEALYPAAIYDLKAALRWIQANAKTYHIDVNSIAIAGFSAGGQLASLIGSTVGNPIFENPDCNKNNLGTVQAIINMDGILSFVHPESGEGDDSKKTSAATYWFGYAKKDNPGLWAQASALTHVNAETPPTLFINSSVVRMHAGRDDYIAILKSYGIYSEVKTFEDAPHSFPLFHPWFEPTVKYIDAFLKKVFISKS